MRKQVEYNNMKIVQKAAMVVIIAAFTFFILNAILSQLIQNKINETKLGSFSVNAGEVKINLLKKKVLLKSVLLKDLSGDNDILIPEISINGIQYFQLLFKKTVSTDSIALNNPVIKVHIGKKLVKTKNIETETSDKLNISVKKVKVYNAGGEIKNREYLIKVSGVNVELYNLSRSKKQQHFYQDFSFSRMSGSVSEWTVPLADDLYTFQGNNLSFNSDNKEFSVENAKIISNYSKYEIGRRRGAETDWFDFSFENIRTIGLELDSLLDNNSFIAKYISIEQFAGSSFRDKRLPFPVKPDTKLPMKIIDSLPFTLHIDSATVNNANIKYEEHVEGADKAGVVFFTHLRANLFQLSNSRNLIQAPTKIVASTKFMNKPLMKACFILPNKKYPLSYHITGTMDPVGFSIFNSIAMENLSVKIKSGRINKFEFDFQYNNEVSNGLLLIEYTDFKINILKQRNDSKNQLQSLIINGIVLKKNNLEAKRNYKKGKIYFVRDKKKSIFNYWWKSLFSGIKSVAIG